MAEVGGRYRPKSRITQGRPPDKYSSRDCRDVNLPTSCACLNEERPSHLGFLERSVRWILLRAQVVGILSSGDTCTQLWIAFSIFQPLLSLQINCNHLGDMDSLERLLWHGGSVGGSVGLALHNTKLATRLLLGGSGWGVKLESARVFLWARLLTTLPQGSIPSEFARHLAADRTAPGPNGHRRHSLDLSRDVLEQREVWGELTTQRSNRRSRGSDTAPAVGERPNTPRVCGCWGPKPRATTTTPRRCTLACSIKLRRCSG